MGYPIYHSQYTAAQIEAAIGKGPRVNTAGYWEVWNVGTGAYESTGVGAGVTPPTVVTQVSQMTNHGYIYIYNGTETGYTAGYWYYWDGSAWTAGGAYQVAATDPTLSIAGAAADAKATGEVKNTFLNSFDNIVGNKIIEFTPGCYINTAGATVDVNTTVPSSTGTHCAVVDVAAGDIFTINCTGGVSPRAYCWIDSSGNVLSNSGEGVSLYAYVITAPTGADKLVLNGKDTDDISFSGIAIDGKITAISGRIDAQQNEIAKDEAILLDEINSPVSLTIQTDGYYDLSGQFISDTGRAYAIVNNVIAGEKYLLSTYLSSTAIAGAIFLDANNVVISYIMRGTGIGEQVTDIPFSVPTGCKKLIIQSASNYLTIFALKKSVRRPTGCIYIDAETLGLGPDVLAGVDGYYVPNTGWSGSKAAGYTHSTGHGDSLSFSTNNIEAGEIYLCEFDTSYADDEFVNVGIGSQYRIPVYNGTSHITVPLLAVGSSVLYFTPLSNKSFTISNITLKKIGGTETNKTLELYNALTDNHTKNYGFWNVLLGKLTAENAVGTTRTLAIGYAALNSLQGGHRNVALGTFALSQMTGGENNVAIGADSMLSVKSALDSIAIGKGAMYNGVLVEDNVAIGHYALTGSASSSNSKRNVAIGKNAGWYSYGQDNTFVGYQAGYRCKNTNGNTCIGKNSYGPESGNHNTAIGEESILDNGISNATAIGYYAHATKSNQVVIGNGSVTEFVLGSKKLIFHQDHTVTWESL